MKGRHINKEFVFGMSLQKAFRLCHQAPLFLSFVAFSICLKEAQFFFEFKYLFFDFTFKIMLRQYVFLVLFKKLFHMTGPRVLI